ncbi:MAG: hypothetical protein PUB14_03650 [Lachnospiraceae bacterium]|nr:hypothetical protein [Lachnospiraceae bacterium]
MKKMMSVVMTVLVFLLFTTTAWAQEEKSLNQVTEGMLSIPAYNEQYSDEKTEENFLSIPAYNEKYAAEPLNEDFLSLDEYRERYSKNVDIKQELKPSLTLQDMSAEILLILSSVKTQTKHIILVLNGTDVGTITLQYQTIIQGGRPQFAYDTCYLSHPKLTTYWSLKSSNMDFSGDKIGVYFSFVYGIFQDHAWVYFKPD